jgi:hypothetical protein
LELLCGLISAPLVTGKLFFLGEFCENIPYYAAYPTVGRSRFLDFQYRYLTTEFGLAKEFYFNFN